MDPYHRSLIINGDISNAQRQIAIALPDERRSELNVNNWSFRIVSIGK